jgi:serine/threonine-protein kinase
MRDDDDDSTSSDQDQAQDSRLTEVVTTYLEAVGDGVVPDRQLLLAKYADVALELEEFFEAQDHLAGLTAPLREVARVATFPHHSPLDSALVDDEDPDSPPDPRLAAVLEARGYELLGKGVRGGGGVVYKARQRRLNRLVAIKTIGVGRQVSPVDLERFRNEAETLGALSHPNIVPVYETAEHEGRLFLLMAYMEGGSLAAHVADYKDDPRTAARLVATAARAVDHAHRHGILHRDLKPSNILLDAAGEPHVSDFGLAKRIDTDSGLTLTGAIVGTPSFIAPEQTLGRRGALTTSTDVYGLGAVLYALLTGRPPFQGETPIDTIDLVRNSAPPRPSVLNRRVGRDLEIICLKCLEKEPSRRYRSALALAEDLERWLEGRPIEARPVGSVVKTWRWMQRNRVIASLLGLTAGVLTFAGIWTMRERAEALNQKAIAIKERDKAVGNLRIARRVIDEFVTDIAKTGLENEPRMEKLLRQKLKKAAEYYQVLARQDSTDPDTRDDAAHAVARLGQIHSLLGEIAPAEQSFRDALRLFERLQVDYPAVLAYRHGRLESLISLAKVLATQMDTKHLEEGGMIYGQAIELCRKEAAQSPEDDGVRYHLARAHLGLAETLRADGRLKDAVRSCRQSISLVDALLGQFPTEASYREHLARSQYQLGLSLHAMAQREDAVPCFRQALSTYDELATAYPSDPTYRSGKAGALHDLAIALHELNDVEGAESSYRAAVEIREKLAEDFPAVPEHRVNLAKHNTMLAILLQATKRPKEAEEAHGKSVKVAETLVRDFPETAQYRLLLAHCQFNLADFRLDHGNPAASGPVFRRSLSELEALPQRYVGRAEFQAIWGMTSHGLGELMRRQGHEIEAKAALEQAVAHQQEAVRLSHGHPVHFDWLVRIVSAQAEHLFDLGESAAALRAIERMSQPPPDDPMNYFVLGIFLGKWSGRMIAEPKLGLSDGERRLLARAYADQAIEILHKAVKSGFKDLASLNAQRALDCLRARDDYKALVRELESKQRADQRR